ncbi:MAG: WG repeat-containing protein [Spirochaetaceae bacterium]|nr:MAG: WG repeat-containing protein [Spirochaetaceae bacterium]
MKKALAILLLVQSGLVFSQQSSTTDDMQLYRVLNNGLWGYIDASGAVRVPAQFDYAFPFRNGFSVVRSGPEREGLRAFISESGDLITDFRFDRAYHFVNGFGKAVVDGKWGFVTETGETLVTFIWDAAGTFSDGHVAVGTGSFRDRRWGLLDAEGRLVLPNAYRRLQYAGEGFWRVSVDGENWALFRPGEGVLQEFPYSRLGSFVDGYLVAERAQRADQDGEDAPLYEVLDARLEVVYSSRLRINAYSEGIAEIREGDRSQYRRVADDTVLGASEGYERAGRFTDGRAIVGIGDNWRERKWGVIAADGSYVVPPLFDGIERFSGEGLARVRVSGVYGFLDTSGRLAVPAVWERTGSFSDGLCPVMRDGKWGYIDSSGTLVIGLEYDRAWDFVDGYAVVRVGSRSEGTRYYIAPDGSVAFGRGFEWAYAFKGPLAHIAEGDFDEGSFGYINRDGEVVWDPRN